VHPTHLDQEDDLFFSDLVATGVLVKRLGLDSKNISWDLNIGFLANNYIIFYKAVLKTRSACLDFDQILGRFFSHFFDGVFGQVFWSRQYSVQFYRDREIQFYRVRRKRREKRSFLNPSF